MLQFKLKNKASQYRPILVTFLFISGLFTPLRSAYSQNIQLDEIPLNSKIEIVAPVQGKFLKDDKYIFISGYKIKIREKTKFENLKSETVSRFEIKHGEWIKIKAKMREDGILTAKKIRQVNKRPLYISLRYDDSVNTILPIDKNNNNTNPLKAFLEDETKGAAFNLYSSENFLLGGKISSALRQDEERDLNKDKQNNKLVAATAFRLDMIWKYGEGGSFLLLEAGSLYVNTNNENKPDTNDSTSVLSRAYTYVVLSDALTMQIGRQDFDEAREWIYDAIQDAVRLYLFRGSYQAELSYSQGPDSLFEKNPDQGIRNLIFNVRYKPRKRFFVGAWYVDRQDTSTRNYNPGLFGLQLINNPNKGLRYWLHLAQATGEINNSKLDGSGIDLGFSYVFKSGLRPYHFAGMASGGGTDPETNKGLFRQTGLQDNNDKFGGVTSYRYYGEVMNPELTNMSISSFGMGFRPLPGLSFDAIFHQYLQVEISDTLVNTRLKADPNGLSDDLGYELDFIAGYRFRELTLELVLGMFTPGQAFNKSDSAKVGRLQVEYKF